MVEAKLGALSASGVMAALRTSLKQRLKIKKFNEASDSSSEDEDAVQEGLAQGRRVVLKMPVWFGAPRAFPENFAEDMRDKPGVHLTELTFWIGGIMYAVQGTYSDGSQTKKYGHDGGSPMTVKIPKSHTRKIVMEVSSECKYCRSIVAYGPNNKILSQTEM